MAGSKTKGNEPEWTDEDMTSKGAVPATVDHTAALIGTGERTNYVPVDFDDAIRYLQEQGVDVVEFEGSPWHVVDKKHLVGKPFLIMGYRINEGDMGTFVSIMAMTKDEVPDINGNRTTRIVINDGSTGIRDQVIGMVTSGHFRTGMLCPNGLRVSEYTYTDPADGKDKPASTYYLG